MDTAGVYSIRPSHLLRALKEMKMVQYPKNSLLSIIVARMETGIFRGKLQHEMIKYLDNEGVGFANDVTTYSHTLSVYIKKGIRGHQIRENDLYRQLGDYFHHNSALHSDWTNSNEIWYQLPSEWYNDEADARNLQIIPMTNYEYRRFLGLDVQNPSKEQDKKCGKKKHKKHSK